LTDDGKAFIIVSFLPILNQKFISLASRNLLKSLARKVGQHKARPVNIGVIVSAQLLLFLARPGAQGLLDVACSILAADHETDLAGWVGWDGGVGVFGDGEDFLAGLLEVGDEGEVEPLVFGYKKQ
jgi:hypothetical protein